MELNSLFLEEDIPEAKKELERLDGYRKLINAYIASGEYSKAQHVNIDLIYSLSNLEDAAYRKRAADRKKEYYRVYGEVTCCDKS